ncbi:hypothetical protein VNI00_012859 [Paramarasmius palmivorus]|uniref:C2H2-type domain-containing protein n=1 Tax=Paramarasmius palmivorus TaxID=297713 RepID=A0AAW0BZR3_9AGAR
MPSEAQVLREPNHHRSWTGEESPGLLNTYPCSTPTEDQRRLYPQYSQPLTAGMGPVYEYSMHGQTGFTGSHSEFQEYHIRYPESSQRTAFQCESSGTEYPIQQASRMNSTTRVTGDSHDPAMRDLTTSGTDIRHDPPHDSILGQTWNSDAQDSKNFYIHPTHHQFQRSSSDAPAASALSWYRHEMDAIVLQYDSMDLQHSSDHVSATSVTAASIPMREGSQWYPPVQQTLGGVPNAAYNQHIMHEPTTRVLSTTTLDHALDEVGLASSVEPSPKAGSDHSSDDMNFQLGQTIGITKKKKKSKMHECEICHKLFPRPSGLRTHMNTHNNVKPFACIFPGCNRSFTVRSNAKRHLRTHGVLPETLVPPSPDYVVNFDAPMVPDSQGQQFGPLPPKLKWMPTSLLDRNNLINLEPVSEDGEDFDSELDELEDDPAVQRCTQAVTVPLAPVAPPGAEDRIDEDWCGDRNSYLVVGSYPYHPSQVKRSPESPYS